MADPLDVSKVRITRCRLCAEQKYYTELLDLAADVKTLCEFLEIIDYLRIDFLDLSEKNVLPKTTCEKCYDLFQDAYKFFKIINQGKGALNSSNFIKTEPSDPAKVGVPSIISKVTEQTSIVTETIIHEENGTTIQDLSYKTKTVKCQFCCGTKPETEIRYLTDGKIKDEYLKIIQFFEINLDLTYDLPKISCNSCFTSFFNAYKFFLNVKSNQNVLNNIYNVNCKYVNKISVKIETGNSESNEDSDSQNDGSELNKNSNPVTYCSVSIQDSAVNTSWTSYTWICCHCQVIFDTVDDLRSHSKDKHNMCNAYSCVDCTRQFGNYDDFVEHVRRHREALRIHCHYCNQPFPTVTECVTHVNTHYEGTQKICELCGEMMPYANTLQWHKKLYAQGGAVGGRQGKSWDDYEWGCQECTYKASDVNSLRTHIQEEHQKCFAMRCCDCPKVMKSYKIFVAHAIGHRPYLKQYCQYCNEHHPDLAGLNQHVLKHITSQQRPCNNCGQIFEDNLHLAKHKKVFCSPKKKPPNPMKRERSNRKKRQITKAKTQPKPRKQRSTSEAREDLNCRICCKPFGNITKLKRHEITHDTSRPRDFICTSCGRSFLSSNTLKEHVKTHSVKTEICQVCKKEFHSKHKLKAHIVTHSELRPFVCDECGSSFKTKRRLKCHLISHSDVKPYKCMFCYKEFKFKENLKTHEYQHTGVRPYCCEYCERTFTNWTNCNKHMIRKHGVTLAKTKITSQGRVAINRRTGEAPRLPSDKNALDWMSTMLKPERRGKKTDSM